jgi:hypothetical protein
MCLVSGIAREDDALHAQMGLCSGYPPCGVSFDLLDLRVELARIGLGRGMCDTR